MISVAFVAIGGYAAKVLNEILSHPSESFRIVAAVDPFAEQSPCYARLKQLGVKFFSSQEEMYAALEEKEWPQFTMISSPIAFHVKQIACAVGHGSHVLCEKPMTGNIEDLTQLDSLAQTGKLIAIGYQWSYSDAIQRLKADIMAGKFGRAINMKSLVFWPRDRHYFTRSTGWAGKIYASNGEKIFDSIVNNATAHYIHNIMYVLGSETDDAAMPGQVEATLLRTNKIETFDTATIRFTLQQGTKGMFVVSHVTKEEVDPCFEYEFEQARVVYPDAFGNIVAYMRDGREVDYGDPFAEGISYKFDCCIRAIERGESGVCGVRAASAQVKFVDLLHRCNKIINTREDHILRRDDYLYVDGLQELLERCYREQKLLNELKEFQDICMES